jgi:prepilin signal peptidase PulO-like enzyme (type II secretory pathway)
MCVYVLALFATALFSTFLASYFDLFSCNTIPNLVWVIGGFIGLAIAVSWLGFSVLLGVHLLFALLLGVSAYVTWYFGAEYFGGGDAKAFIMLGVILGPYSFAVIGFAVIALGVFGLVWLVSVGRKSKEKTLRVPFIPFLALGVFLAMKLYGVIPPIYFWI